jgi:phage terminase large subunit-like protein
MVCWALFASRRTVRGVVAAADLDQAKLLRNALEALVRLNPWLAKILEVQAARVINTHTGSEAVILASDAASNYGLLVDFIVCDELTHWSRPDLWESLFSASAKRANCVLVVITNAGFGDSWQHALRESIRGRADWLLSRLDGPQASWITEATLAEQRALLPDIAFRRLWLNEWTQGTGDAFSPADLEACVALAGPLEGPEAEFQYCCGVDIGLRHDSSAVVVVGRHVGRVERVKRTRPAARDPVMRALADIDDGGAEPVQDVVTIFHRGTGRLKLAALRVWTPERGRTVDLQSVESTIAELANRFGVGTVACDPWNAAQLAQNLARRGLRPLEAHPTGANLQLMARTLLDAITDRQLDLFADPTLLADLRALRVTEKSYGFRLTAPRRSAGDSSGTRHADTASALQLALFAARGLSPERLGFEARPLVLSPVC